MLSTSESVLPKAAAVIVEIVITEPSINSIESPYKCYQHLKYLSRNTIKLLYKFTYFINVKTITIVENSQKNESQLSIFGRTQ